MTALMMNSMRARPTPLAGSRHQRKAAAGLAMFSIIAVRVFGMAARSISVAAKSSAPS
jgi:hypothetical protein